MVENLTLLIQILLPHFDFQFIYFEYQLLRNGKLEK